MKVLVNDGIGVWLAACRLNSGKFVWPGNTHATDATVTLTRAQLNAPTYKHMAHDIKVLESDKTIVVSTLLGALAELAYKHIHTQTPKFL